MDRKQKFEIFNKIIEEYLDEACFVEFEGTSEPFLYVRVEDNPGTRELLYSLGFEDKIINANRDEEIIDLVPLVMRMFGDDWYFVSNTFIEKEEKEKWDAISLLIDLGLTPNQYKQIYEREKFIRRKRS